MPEGYVAWVIWLIVSTTIFWAAVWWWLPALFKDKDREPPKPPERDEEQHNRHSGRSDNPLK